MDTGVKGIITGKFPHAKEPKESERTDSPKLICNGRTQPGKTLIEALAEWDANWETRETVRRTRTLNATKNTMETRGTLERNGETM